MILLGAASILEKRGWVQKVSEDASGACCVQGAIHYAAYGTATEPSMCVLGMHAQVSKAFNRLRACLPRNRIIPWNDAEGRTKEEVISKLREAAEIRGRG